MSAERAKQLYRCHECDDWKSAAYCPDCGNPCAIYVRGRKLPAPAGDRS